jgi:hypothetical protein
MHQVNLSNAPSEKNNFTSRATQITNMGLRPFSDTSPLKSRSLNDRQLLSVHQQSLPISIAFPAL